MNVRDDVVKNGSEAYVYVRVDKTIYVPVVNVRDDVVKNESKAYVVA